MHLDVKHNYIVTLNSQELRLVGLALAQRLKDTADVADAAELNKKLLQLKAAALQDQMVKVTVALNHAEKAETP